MKIVCCSFKKAKEAEDAIQKTEKSLKEENLTIKDIKIIDRMFDSKIGNIIEGMLIIMAE